MDFGDGGCLGAVPSLSGDEAVADFVSLWGLDETAHQALMEKPLDVQARVISSFQPKPGTRNPTGLFFGFLKSISGGPPGLAAQRGVRVPPPGRGAVPAPPPQFAPDTAGLWVHSDFQDAGDFQQDAGDLPPEEIEGSVKVVSTAGGAVSIQRLPAFAVRGGAGYQAPGGAAGAWVVPPPQRARGWASAEQDMLPSDDATAFCARFGLDADAEKKLLQLDPTTQARVIREFAPRAGTRDVSRLFHGFIRSVSSGPPAPGAIRPCSGGLWRGAHAGAAAGVEQLGAGAHWPDAQGDAVAAWCTRWGLDEGCRAALLQLDPTVQRQIMQDFAPRPNTQDVTRLFYGFIKSVSGRTPRAPLGIQRAAGVPGVAQGCKRAPLGADGAALGGDDAPSPEEIALFLQVWDLSEAAAAALEAQPPEVQRRVLNEFQPKAGTRDNSSLFHGFLRSVAGSVASGAGGKRPRATPPTLYYEAVAATDPLLGSGIAWGA